MRDNGISHNLNINKKMKDLNDYYVRYINIKEKILLRRYNNPEEPGFYIINKKNGEWKKVDPNDFDEKFANWFMNQIENKIIEFERDYGAILSVY